MINAIEAAGDNPLFSRRPVEVNISIYEADPNWVTIETVGIMEGAATDWGITEGVVSQFYKDVENRLR